MAAVELMESCADANLDCRRCHRLADCQKLQSWLAEKCADHLLDSQTLLKFARRFANLFS